MPILKLNKTIIPRQPKSDLQSSKRSLKPLKIKKKVKKEKVEESQNKKTLSNLKPKYLLQKLKENKLSRN